MLQFKLFRVVHNDWEEGAVLHHGGGKLFDRLLEGGESGVVLALAG